MQKQAVSAGGVGEGGSVAFIMDGFPRTLESAELWEDKIRALIVSLSILMWEGWLPYFAATDMPGQQDLVSSGYLDSIFSMLPSQNG